MSIVNQPKARNTGIQYLRMAARDTFCTILLSPLWRRIQAVWGESMTHLPQKIVGIDSAICMHLQTSGQIQRRPHGRATKTPKKISRGCVVQNALCPGNTTRTNTAADKLLQAAHSLLYTQDLNGLHERIGTAGPIANASHWAAVWKFKWMVVTPEGALAQDTQDFYLHPETAQGTFLTFLNLQKSARRKVLFERLFVSERFTKWPRNFA